MSQGTKSGKMENVGGQLHFDVLHCMPYERAHCFLREECTHVLFRDDEFCSS